MRHDFRKISLKFLFSVGVAQSSALFAACALPNTLTNGTIADANQVMADLNMAATCGGIYNIGVGVPTSFSNVNIGGNSTLLANGARSITIKAGTATPTAPTLYGIAIPAPSTTPYMVAILAVPNFPAIRFSGAAVGFYDSSTGKLVTLVSFRGSAFGAPGYSFQNWTSATSRASISEPALPRDINYGPTWFGIKDDGNTISFLISQDGANFYPLGFSQAKSGGYLSSYSNIFIGLFNDAESGSDGAANQNVSVTYLAYDVNGLSRLAGN